MARIVRCTEPTGMPVPIEIAWTLRPAFLSWSRRSQFRPGLCSKDFWRLICCGMFAIETLADAIARCARARLARQGMCRDRAGSPRRCSRERRGARATLGGRRSIDATRLRRALSTRDPASRITAATSISCATRHAALTIHRGGKTP
jgi:hypothetical protein